MDFPHTSRYGDAKVTLHLFDRRSAPIRVALGAARGQLAGMILRQPARVVGVGIGIGVLFGVLATIMARSYIYRISPIEWTGLIPLSTVMWVLSLLIAYLSARPWPNADAMEAVRHA